MRNTSIVHYKKKSNQTFQYLTIEFGVSESTNNIFGVGERVVMQILLLKQTE